jgi:hypothetical protein
LTLSLTIGLTIDPSKPLTRLTSRVFHPSYAPEPPHQAARQGTGRNHRIAGRRFVVFISKHLTGARMDTRDLAAPGCIMALQ